MLFPTEFFFPENYEKHYKNPDSIVYRAVFILSWVWVFNDGGGRKDRLKKKSFVFMTSIFKTNAVLVFVGKHKFTWVTLE